MRVTVFGATGATGRLVVREGLDRGLDLTAFTRSADAVFDASVRVATGDARDAGAVRAAVEDTDAVVSVLGIGSRTEPTTDLSEATRTITTAMASSGVRRIVITANTSVFDDEAVTGPYAAAAQEHRRDVAILRDGETAWSVLAPPWLKDDPPIGSYRHALDVPAPGRSITRGDLAAAVLDALGHDDWIGHIVGVTN
ncbi:MAG: NAD(P)H-binding protein [Actinomycetota bacterium]